MKRKFKNITPTPRVSLAPTVSPAPMATTLTDRQCSVNGSDSGGQPLTKKFKVTSVEPYTDNIISEISKKTNLDEKIICKLLNLNVNIGGSTFLVAEIIKSKCEIQSIFEFKPKRRYTKEQFKLLKNAVCYSDDEITLTEFNDFMMGFADSPKFSKFLKLGKIINFAKKNLDIYFSLYKHIENLCSKGIGIKHFSDQLINMSLKMSFDKCFRALESHSNLNFTMRAMCRIILYLCRPYKNDIKIPDMNFNMRRQCTPSGIGGISGMASSSSSSMDYNHFPKISVKGSDFDTMDVMYGNNICKTSKSKTQIVNNIRYIGAYKKASMYFREAIVNLLANKRGIMSSFANRRKMMSSGIPLTRELDEMMGIQTTKKKILLPYTVPEEDLNAPLSKIDIKKCTNMCNTMFTKFKNFGARVAIILQLNDSCMGCYTDANIHNDLSNLMDNVIKKKCPSDTCGHLVNKWSKYCEMCGCSMI